MAFSSALAAPASTSAEVLNHLKRTGALDRLRTAAMQQLTNDVSVIAVP
jgi:hypothetical protein